MFYASVGLAGVTATFALVVKRDENCYPCWPHDKGLEREPSN